ncbi:MULTISPECIES: class I SAM-dependent methyltransferase [unclassified Rhizobium]
MEKIAQTSLEFTGERFHPELEGEIRQEHMHRYAWCRDLATGKDVVDVASGEGFGTALLSEQAKSIIGIDVSAEAVAHARKRYVRDNLQFSVGDAAAINLPDASADLVISFETIEHINDQERAVAEFSRILRHDGILVISSPNVDTYSVRQDYENPFHTKELNRDDFVNLLKVHFGAVRVFGQRMLVTSALLPSDPTTANAEVLVDEGTITRVTREGPESMYFIAVAAREARHLPQRDASFLLSETYDVYWQQKDELAENRTKIVEMQEDLFQHGVELARIKEDLSSHKSELARITTVLSLREADILRLEHSVVAANGEAMRFRSDAIALRTERGLENQLKHLHVIKKSGLFDRHFYAAQKNDPSLRGSKLLEDYVINGEKAGLAPSSAFDPVFYAASYPDVVESGMGLLMHYIISGRQEGRLPKAR